MVTNGYKSLYHEAGLQFYGKKHYMGHCSSNNTIVRNSQRNFLGPTGSKIWRMVQTATLGCLYPVSNQFNLVCLVSCIKHNYCILWACTIIHNNKYYYIILIITPRWKGPRIFAVTALIHAWPWFSAVTTPFLTIDRDKMTTSGTRIVELHAWYRSNFSDTLLNTWQLASS